MNTSIYGVDENGNAAVRVTTNPATTTDPTSIYGIDDNGNAAMRIMGAGGGEGGTSNYNELSNKPQINGVTLSGNKTASELGISGAIQISVAGRETVQGFSVPKPTAEELTAIYNAVVGGNSVQIVDNTDVYYQVMLADSMDGAINVEIMFFSELAILYSLEHDVVTIEAKKIGDSTQVVEKGSGIITQELASDAIYNCGETTSITLTLPATMDAKFISQLNFTSGSTPTSITAPNTVVWLGNDITGGVFVPVANKRYCVLFFHDGTAVRGLVQGA